MSTDAKYLIQFYGPYGKDEIVNYLRQLNELPVIIPFHEVGYGTVYGETKHIHDGNIFIIIDNTAQVLRGESDLNWKIIYQP